MDRNFVTKPGLEASRLLLTRDSVLWPPLPVPRECDLAGVTGGHPLVGGGRGAAHSRGTTDEAGGEAAQERLPGRLRRPGAAATTSLGSVLPFPALAVTRGHWGLQSCDLEQKRPHHLWVASLTRSRMAGCTPTRMAVGGGQVTAGPSVGLRWPGHPPRAFLHQRPRQDGTGPFRKHCCHTCSGRASLWVPGPWVPGAGCNDPCPADLTPAELCLHTQDAAGPQLPPAQPCAPPSIGCPE